MTADDAINKSGLTISEAAHRMRVGESTIRRWVYNGDIRAYRLGGCIRILPEDLDSKLVLIESEPSD